MTKKEDKKPLMVPLEVASVLHREMEEFRNKLIVARYTNREFHRRLQRLESDVKKGREVSQEEIAALKEMKVEP